MEQPTIRDLVQDKAALAFQNTGPIGKRAGTVAGATGFGKTFVALSIINKDYMDKRILISVPSIKLRDRDWPAEMEKWNVKPENLRLICHASMHKIDKDSFDLVIMDEGHHLTVLMRQLFEKNTVRDVLFLTATFPDTDEFKYELISELAPVIFKYSLGQAVEDGSVADFEVTVTRFALDNVRKVIPCGSKKKRWFATEQGYYQWLNKCIKRAFAQKKGGEDYWINKRADFIRTLPSKVEYGKRVLKMPKVDEKRWLLFCGSIQMSKDICKEWVYNSESGNEYFNKFCDLLIWYLGVVRAVDEGQNLPLVDGLFIVSPEKSARRMVQRIGRAIRKRENHVAQIFIACAIGTADEVWIEEALSEIPPEKVKYVTVKNPYLW